MALFSTTGIRGISNHDMTPEFALQLGYTFGTFTGKGKKILIARDTRTSSEMLKNSFVSGLLSTGNNVFDAGIIPIPVVNFSVKGKYDAGVMITSSHNPPEYNGIKFILSNGLEFAEKEEMKFEKIYASKKFKLAPWNEIGSYKKVEILSAYVEKIKTLVDLEKIKQRNFKIVADVGNGTQTFLIPQILKEAGCEATILNYSTDGFFSRIPEPRPDTLIRLIELVLSKKSDLGVAYDVDGDRAIFVTENGEVLMGDVTGSLLAAETLKNHGKGTIVTTVATSSLIDDVVNNYNGKIIKTEVGANAVGEALLKSNAIFGFEENGGCVFPELSPARDGAFKTLKILELLAQESRSFSEIISELPKYYQAKARVECPEKKKHFVMQRIKSLAKELKQKTDITDGIKILLGNGSVLIRPSGTEPLIRVFVESKFKKDVEELLEKWVSEVKRIQ